jgi:hypothetical protein
VCTSTENKSTEIATSGEAMHAAGNYVKVMKMLRILLVKLECFHCTARVVDRRRYLGLIDRFIVSDKYLLKPFASFYDITQN